MGKDLFVNLSIIDVEAIFVQSAMVYMHAVLFQYWFVKVHVHILSEIMV